MVPPTVSVKDMVVSGKGVLLYEGQMGDDCLTFVLEAYLSGLFAVRRKKNRWYSDSLLYVVQQCNQAKQRLGVDGMQEGRVRACLGGDSLLSVGVITVSLLAFVPPAAPCR